MLFTRINTFYFPVGKEELKSRLIGSHVNIHNLDFEIFEKDRKLSIIPHAEQIDDIKTLPITSIVFKEENNHTKVTVTSRMRMLDAGGPILLISFCTFMIVASLYLLQVSREPTLAYTFMGMSTSILTVFGIRMHTGYFDYVRKIQGYVKNMGSNNYENIKNPLAHA